MNKVEGLEIGSASSTEEIHFSGGLRGFQTDRGWALVPVSEDPDQDALVFRTPQAHFDFATRECGLRFIGTCVHYRTGENSPQMDIWEWGARDPANGLSAADSWGAVAHQARVQGDEEYANSASYLSACLKASGLRLRDVSDGYGDQLKWALAENRKPGGWFSNAALLDLYSDCHSLASELSSARDHLSRIAGIHAGAPKNKDSLARLEEWVAKASNNAHASQPLIQLLLTASGTGQNPNWLRKLGEVRNEMLHKVPMASNKRVSGIVMQSVKTTLGEIKTIRLGEPTSTTPLASQAPDSLIELSQLGASMERLCRDAWKVAKYPAELPTFYAE